MSENIDGSLKPAEHLQLQRLSERVLTGQVEGLTAQDKKRVEKAREHLFSGNWETSMRDVEGDMHDVGEHVNKLINKFGLSRKESGEKKRGNDVEGKRFKRANDALKGLIPILESGNYDQMKPDDQKAIREQVINSFKQNSRLPGFDRMPGKDQQALVEKCLRDPQLKEEIVSGLKKIQGMSLTKEEDVLKARRDYEVAQAKHDEATRAKADAQEGLESTTNRLNQFKAGNKTGLSGEAAVIGNMISTIDGELDKLSQEEDRLNKQLEGLGQREIPAKTADQAAFYAQIDRQTNTITSALQKASDKRERYLQSKTQHQARLEAISPSEEVLEEKRNVVKKAASEAALAGAGTDTDLLATKIAYEDLKEEREGEESAIAAQLEGVLSKAVERYVVRELQASNDRLIINEKEFKNELSEKVAKQLKEHMGRRWNTKARPRKLRLFRKGDTEPAQNTNQVNRDFDALMHKGADQLMRDALRIMPAIQALGSPEAIKEQVDAMMDNTEFKSEFRTELIKQVLSRRMLIKRITPTEAQQILSLSELSSNIQSALDTNQQNLQRIHDLSGTDIPMTYFEALRARKRANAAQQQPVPAQAAA